LTHCCVAETAQIAVLGEHEGFRKLHAAKDLAHGIAVLNFRESTKRRLFGARRDSLASVRGQGSAVVWYAALGTVLGAEPWRCAAVGAGTIDQAKFRDRVRIF
jgi:hypothetical protein